MVHKPFAFRPKETKRASDRARKVLQCLQCGNIVKRSTTNNPANRGFVGCRNDKLLGSRMLVNPQLTNPQRVQLMASYYSRLQEYFDLGGPKFAIWRDYYGSREEHTSLKSMVYQSLCTTVQAHFKIGRTQMLQKYGQTPGGFPVPNDQRPPVFQLELEEEEATRRKKRFQFTPWQCVRSDGCVCTWLETKPQNINRRSPEAGTSAPGIPEELEEAILTIIVADKNIRRFQTLETKSRAFVKPGRLLPLLQQLKQEGKVNLPNLETQPKRPHSSLTGRGRRRLLYLEQRRGHGKLGKRLYKEE